MLGFLGNTNQGFESIYFLLGFLMESSIQFKLLFLFLGELSLLLGMCKENLIVLFESEISILDKRDIGVGLGKGGDGV